VEQWARRHVEAQTGTPVFIGELDRPVRTVRWRADIATSRPPGLGMEHSMVFHVADPADEPALAEFLEK
jgi:hypothetical protein